MDRHSERSVSLGTVPDIIARLLLLLLLLHAGFLGGFMMTDGATRTGTEQAMMAGVVTCDAADDRSLQATCCVCRHRSHRDA